MKKLIYSLMIAVLLFLTVPAKAAIIIDDGTGFIKLHHRQIQPITEPVQQEQKELPFPITPAEKDLLARLVRAEAQNQSLNGKVAVAEVVLNRVKNDRFPDSIYDVIYQKNQFSPAANGSINQPADEESIAAVEIAISSDESIVKDALYFYNPSVVKNSWLNTLEFIVQIEQHVFKK